MSEVVASYNEEWEMTGYAYPPEGCRIMIGREKCGETRGLDIIMDFHKLYQEKMSQIDVSAGGDSLQEKVDLQQQWIKDLTDQNKMLARVIEELESEAIGRVQQLENKLNNATKSLGENDKDALNEKDKKIRELEEALKQLPTAEELKNKSQENEQLKKDMTEVRLAMGLEIANKHDTISLLRDEICNLQDKSIDTQKEVSLKNDIIRELRRELKKYKGKMSVSDRKAESQTEDKETTTGGNGVVKINHSSIPEDANHSTIIFIHKGQTEEKRDLAFFESSDSSECGLNEGLNYSKKGVVHSCKSENDIKMINWMKSSKERSKLTQIHKNEDGDHQNYGRNLKIPKHIPVKTYINNIEFTKELS